MNIHFTYGKKGIDLVLPDNSTVFSSCYEPMDVEVKQMMLHSIVHPINSTSLDILLRQRKKGKIVVVVSDITRPIPYYSFLPELLDFIVNQGIGKNEIELLVATGMHRASTMQERIYMFGKTIVDNYSIIDHDAEEVEELEALNKKSWSDNEIKLNRHYVDAGFRIITGLVETHFMAGFSGGRKSICPGLASLDTIQRFHGYNFLNHPGATNAQLENNPCHLETNSVALACPADFSINIVLDQQKQINRFFSGDLFVAHEAAIHYVREKSCKKVENLADVVITSCGGYPLDDTFYQCVKGFVNCLPALKEKGTIIAFGGCSEGIGSPEYEQLMKRYSYRSDDFLNDIQKGDFFIKDQWQLQMQTRVLKKIGQENLHFYTSGIPQKDLLLLSVNAHHTQENILTTTIQKHIDSLVSQGKKMAIFPEGPYCSSIPFN